MNLDEYNWIEESERAHRSVSQLTSWSACGEAFRLERVARVPQRPAAWFIQGHATHAAIEEWERSKRSITLPDLEGLYLDSYRDEEVKLMEKWPDEAHWMTGGARKGFADLSEREDRGWAQVLGYVEWAMGQSHLWEIIDVERGFRQLFGDVPVRGFIDQIALWGDGTIEPRDLKSGTKTPASALQLIVYALVIERVTGLKVRGASFVKLLNPNGRSKAATATQHLEIDLQQEAAYLNPEFLDQLFRDADRGIDAQIFLPNPTDGCDRVCGVQQWCRIKGTGTSAQQRQEGLLPLAVANN